MTQPREERRQKKRVPATFMVHCRFGVPVQFGFGIWRTEGNALAMDLSEGGLSMDLESALPLQTKVSVIFSLSGESGPQSERRRTFEFTGEVRDCRATPEKSYRLGIRFTGVSEADRAFIAAYVRDTG